MKIEIELFIYSFIHKICKAPLQKVYTQRCPQPSNGDTNQS